MPSACVLKEVRARTNLFVMAEVYILRHVCPIKVLFYADSDGIIQKEEDLSCD